MGGGCYQSADRIDLKLASTGRRSSRSVASMVPSFLNLENKLSVDLIRKYR